MLRRTKIIHDSHSRPEKAGNIIGSPEWETVRDRYLQTYRNVCGWHERIGFEEMVDHTFLDAARLVQETAFGNGLRVVVISGPTAWRDPRGFTVEPNGYRPL